MAKEYEGTFWVTKMLHVLTMVVVTWCMHIFAKTQTQTKMVTFIVLNYTTIWLIFKKKYAQSN